MASSYPYPSEVDVKKFVTVKLSKTNYLTWKPLMLRLIKEQGLEGFINGDVSAESKMIEVPSDDCSTMITKKNPKYEDWKNSNKLLQKWIIDTLSTDDDIHTLVKRPRMAKNIWANLEKYYNPFSYPYPSSEVNVEKFVTIKLSKINYFTWKTPMLRLIKRHGLEGFINGNISTQPKMIKVLSGDGSRMIKEENPIHEYWKRSDDLLKDWILHTLSSDDDIYIVEHSRSVKQVWEKLEKQHTTEMRKNQTQYLPLIKAIVDGDLGETQEFLDRYPDAIRTPITNFSSTPLLVAAESGKRNHLVRELVDRMLPDDLSHADQSGCTALHVAARGGNTEVAKLLVEKNPQLPYVLNAYEELPLHVAASSGHKDMVVYLLGVTNEDTVPTTIEHKLGTKLVNDLITGELYARSKFNLHISMASSYPYPSEVDVKKFVTVKLSKTNYLTWKPLMLRLIKEQGLEGFINGDVSAESKMIEVPSDGSSTMITKKNPKYEDWKNINKLLQKWIIDTLSTDDDIHTLVKRPRMAKNIWANLEKYYNPFSYPYPSSEVNVEKFVTIKLSKINYFTWKTPMLRLIKRHGLEGFINGDISTQPKMIKVLSGDGSRMIKEENPIHEYWKRSDDLLKDWILHTLSSDDDIYIVEHSRSVKQVLEKLEKQHTTEMRKNQTRYLPLMKAIVDGDWGKTQEFLDQKLGNNQTRYPDAIRAPITNFSSTPLMVAAESGKRNHLVRELVKRMSEDDLAHADQSGCTALHVAARGGNTEVATLLVEKNPQLPYVLNAYEELPVHVAASNGHKDMVVYLLGVTKEDTVPTTIEHKLGTKLVNDLITGELYGIALFVVQHNPKLACGDPSPLAVLAKMPSAFLSGAHLNFLQHFIYSCVPMLEENINLSAKLYVPDDPTNVENIENCSTDTEDINSDNILVPNIPTQMENTENYSTDRGDIESANSVVPSVPKHVENSDNHSTDRRDIESANCFVPILLHVIANVMQKLCGLFWKLADSVSHIKNMRERKLIHYQSQQLVQVLCSKIVKLAIPFSKIEEPLRIAVEDGVHEVVENIRNSFPNAIYYGYYNDLTTFRHAIKNRCETLFNFVCQIGEYHNRLLSDFDESGNECNCLHLAGHLGKEQNFNLKASAAGAALQMQRELQWFKAVEKLVPIKDKGQKNKDHKTPAMVFTETHLELVKEGEKWMKDTANSCIIVATLVVTIMFAAAITVPGGNNGNTGLPFFATKKVFIVFAITDALALFSSTSSVLMFLSILTSRYAAEDFLCTLPKRLIFGLGTLFLSILFMMIAFATTLEILFGDEYPWIIIPVVAFSSVPVILFVSLQSPLFWLMIKSTYFPRIFRKKRDRLFSQESIDTS